MVNRYSKAILATISGSLVDFDVESGTSNKSENVVGQSQKQGELPFDETNPHDTMQSSPTSTQTSFLSVSHSKLFDQSCSPSTAGLISSGNGTTTCRENANHLNNELVCIS